MEITKLEVAAVEQVVAEAQGVTELNELELALVGGGIGNVIIG